MIEIEGPAVAFLESLTLSSLDTSAFSPSFIAAF